MLAAAAAGLAGGFVVARLVEARSARVPPALALSMWHTPIGQLAADLAARNKPAPPPKHPLDPDAPLLPAGVYDT